MSVRTVKGYFCWVLQSERQRESGQNLIVSRKVNGLMVGRAAWGGAGGMVTG